MNGLAVLGREESDHPRSEAPLERDEPTRRFQRLCFRALAEEAISESKATELLGLPVSEIEQIMSGPVV